MKKKLFTNYNFEFDKNERKLLTSFCKQALKQIGDDKQFYGEVRALSSILDKLNSDTETVKLTKDERTRLVHQLKQNIDYISRQVDKSWFIKKWLMRSLYNQYTSLFENHFKG